MRAIISLVGALFFILIVIVLFNAIFGGGSSSPVISTKPLMDYATTNAEVSFKTDGAINGEDEHRSIEIIVNNRTRHINVIQGYQGRIIKDASFPNNSDAYAAFLAALDKAGFTSERKTRLTEPGICPQGERYNFDLVGTDGDDSHLWSASCEKGTLGGSRSVIEDLFQAQITNYSDFTADIEL